MMQTVKSLQDSLNSTIAQVKPRSRFQFKRPPKTTGHVDMGAPMNDPRLNPGSLPPNSLRSSATSTSAPSPSTKEAHPSQKDYNAELRAQKDAPLTRRPSFANASSVTLTNHSNLHIVLPASASSATGSGSLTSLHRCVIDLSIPTISKEATQTPSPFRGLAMRDISDSVIVAGRVDGPVHITAVSNSIIVVIARQVRIHECKNVDVYLHCGSHPIIEDCRGMRFAPLPSRYVRPPPTCHFPQGHIKSTDSHKDPGRTWRKPVGPGRRFQVAESWAEPQLDDDVGCRAAGR